MSSKLQAYRYFDSLGACAINYGFCNNTLPNIISGRMFPGLVKYKCEEYLLYPYLYIYTN
jgi:hypothetical protein